MANYAFIENNEIFGVYDLLPKNWRNISNFDLIDDWNKLNELGWYKLEKIIPNYDSEKQKIDNPNHYLKDGVPYETYDVIDLEISTQKVFDSISLAWQKVYDEKDRRLRHFQWRIMRHQTEIENNMLPTEDYIKLQQYVYDLQTISSQSDPENIVWPVYVE